MKIQCNVCEAAEANVLCCADEAALCWRCDQKVHAANKLASKHQRVPLSSSLTQMPKCDICQESVGYFFCLEDRALLCRKCDVAIHSVNALVSAHQRFLLTGVRVGLEAAKSCPSSSTVKSHSNRTVSEPEPRSVPKQTTPLSSYDQHGQSSSLPTGVRREGISSSKLSFAGGSTTENLTQWPLDEFLGLDFNLNYNNSTNNDTSSKADSGKLGDSDCSSTLRETDGILDGEEGMDQVQDTFWAVPQIPSPPTASGLYWPKTYLNSSSDCAISVPEIRASQWQPLYHGQPYFTNPKRRKQS